MNRRCIGHLFVVATTLALQVTLGADDWPGARLTEVFSDSREWFVRVTPGTSLGDTVGFAGSPKGPFARAEWYQRGSDRSYRLVREVTLGNPVAPVKYLVTDRGYLATLDDWHNMGYGVALASYGPDGRRIEAYALSDLFAPEELTQFKVSTSSIWWRTENAYVREGQRSVYVTLDDSGGELIFEPESGRWQICAQRSGRQQCRSSNRSRVWRPYREPEG